MTDLAVATPTDRTHDTISCDLRVELGGMPRTTISITREDWEHPYVDPIELLAGLRHQSIKEMIDALFRLEGGPQVRLVQMTPAGSGILRLRVMVSDGRSYDASTHRISGKQQYDAAVWQRTSETLHNIVKMMSTSFTVRPVNDF